MFSLNCFLLKYQFNKLHLTESYHTVTSECYHLKVTTKLFYIISLWYFISHPGNLQPLGTPLWIYLSWCNSLVSTLGCLVGEGACKKCCTSILFSSLLCVLPIDNTIAHRLTDRRSHKHRVWKQPITSIHRKWPSCPYSSSISYCPHWGH